MMMRTCLASVLGAVAAYDTDVVQLTDATQDDDFHVLSFTTQDKDYTLESILERMSEGVDGVHLQAHMSHDHKIFLFPGSDDSHLFESALQLECPASLCGSQEDLGERLKITPEQYGERLNETVKNLPWDTFMKFIALEATGSPAMLLEDIVDKIPAGKTLWIELACTGAACPGLTALSDLLGEKQWPMGKVNLISKEYSGQLLASTKMLVERAGKEVNFKTALSIVAHDHAQGWRYDVNKKEYYEGIEKGSLEKQVKQTLSMAQDKSIDYVMFEADDRVIGAALEASNNKVTIFARQEHFVDADSAALALKLKRMGVKGYATDYPADVKQWVLDGRPDDVVVATTTAAGKKKDDTPAGGFPWMWIILGLVLLLGVAGYFASQQGGSNDDKPADDKPAEESELPSRA